MQFATQNLGTDSNKGYKPERWSRQKAADAYVVVQNTDSKKV